MSELAVITPTWSPDAELLDELHRSVLEFTPETTIHHLIVSSRDKPRFARYAGPRCRVWTHADLLPRRYLRTPGNMWVNLRRPWPPVRGWVMQQAAKIAAAAMVDARVVLLADSDAILVRPVTSDELMSGGTVKLYRAANAVHAGMPRHVLWHTVARRLLGVPGTAVPPLPDYVNPINLWQPGVVRAMQRRITEVTGHHWLDAVTAKLHISEFILYGVFVDHLHGAGTSPRLVDDRFCLHYFEREPMDARAAVVFTDRARPDTIGIMISSHSGTPHAVRQLAARRCTEMTR